MRPDTLVCEEPGVEANDRARQLGQSPSYGLEGHCRRLEGGQEGRQGAGAQEQVDLPIRPLLRAGQVINTLHSGPRRAAPPTKNIPIKIVENYAKRVIAYNSYNNKFYFFALVSGLIWVLLKPKP